MGGIVRAGAADNGHYHPHFCYATCRGLICMPPVRRIDFHVSRSLISSGECRGMKHRRALISSIVVVALLVSGCGLWVWQAKRQYALNRQLMLAILHQDTKQAVACIQMGADPNIRHEIIATSNFFSPAEIKRMLQKLLPHHPSSHDRDPTALTIAVLFEQEEVVHLLLTHGAQVNPIEPENNPAPLFLADSSCNTTMVKDMLAFGAKVKAAHIDLVMIEESAHNANPQAREIARILKQAIAKE